MSALQTVILGIVEGITEFLPISSTGHLILMQHVLGIGATDAVKTFDIAIQLGAILAAVVVYWRTLLFDRRTLGLVLAAFLPTAIIGVVVHGPVKQYLLDSPTVVAWSLLVGGIALIAFERMFRPLSGSDLRSMTMKQAVTIGIVQTLAVIPGTSRSAATILGGMALGMSRAAVVDFSFLLAIPTMAGATALDLLKSADALAGSDIRMIGLGFFVSFVSAFFAIRWLLQFIRSHDFTSFGVYRIALGLLFLLWLY